MNTDEIVRALREMATYDCGYEEESDAAMAAIDLIESLQAQLAASQRREKAAVDDMTHITDSIANCKEFLSGGIDKVNELKFGRCDVCKGACHKDKPCNFEWRGVKGASDK